MADQKAATALNVIEEAIPVVMQQSVSNSVEVHVDTVLLSKPKIMVRITILNVHSHLLVYLNIAPSSLASLVIQAMIHAMNMQQVELF